jgi:hypothetical protein
MRIELEKNVQPQAPKALLRMFRSIHAHHLFAGAPMPRHPDKISGFAERVLQAVQIYGSDFLIDSALLHRRVASVRSNSSKYAA